LYRKVVKALRFEEQEKELQWWGAHIYVHLLARLVWRIKIENEGGHLFPQYGPGILVSNHESHFDPFFVGAATKNIRIQWMSKKGNFLTPLVKTLFTNLGAFMLDRDNPQEGWEKAQEILAGGQWVGIFPEGTRNIDGEMADYKTGAVRLAIEAGVPIVPAAILGSANVLPKGSMMVKPAKVTVRVGRPIFYDEYSADDITYDLITKLSAELKQKVQDLLDGNASFSSKKKVETKELSIGSPQDAEKKSDGFKKTLKIFGTNFLKFIDDSWFSLLKSLEVFGIRRPFEDIVYHFSANLVHFMSNTIFPFREIGFEENMPKKGAAVVCSNHNSEWDVIMNATIVGQHGRQLFQMAKESLFKIPIVNAWVRTHHAFPLMRDESDVGSYVYGKKCLENGDLVMVYPEGTTVGGPEVLEGHTGAVRMAIEAKVPILPIGITGTEETYPKHAKMINFGKGSVYNMGEPFMEHAKYFNEPMPDYMELKRLTDSLMARITSLNMYDNKDI
jgi:1-acyl-sn-glycerol-3-phosphate acyltransferase